MLRSPGLRWVLEVIHGELHHASLLFVRRSEGCLASVVERNAPALRDLHELLLGFHTLLYENVPKLAQKQPLLIMRDHVPFVAHVLSGALWCGNACVI